MKNKALFGVITLFVIGIVGISIATAHGGGYGMMWGDKTVQYSEMTDEMEKIMETGSFEDLTELREKYDIPILHWVNNEEDFNLAKQMHEKFEGPGGFSMMGYGSPCHS